MCLIIHKPADAEFPFEEHFPSIYEGNSDGFGMMWFDNGGVQVRKILPKTARECIEAFKEVANKDVGVHFRMRTHGATDIARVHPYPVFSRDNGDKFDLFLMHNGVLSRYTKEAKEDGDSDSLVFVKGMLRPLITKWGLELLDDDQMRVLVEDHIGSGNKLLLLGGDGKFRVFNKQAGNEDRFKGCWLSNTYALARGSSKKAGTVYSGWGHNSSEWGGNYYGSYYSGRKEDGAARGGAADLVTFPGAKHCWKAGGNKMEVFVQKETKKAKEEVKVTKSKKEVKKESCEAKAKVRRGTESPADDDYYDELAVDLYVRKLFRGMDLDAALDADYNSIFDAVIEEPEDVAEFLWDLFTLWGEGMVTIDYDPKG